jgi:hypothetical protein
MNVDFSNSFRYHHKEDGILSGRRIVDNLNSTVSDKHSFYPYSPSASYHRIERDDSADSNRQEI